MNHNTAQILLRVIESRIEEESNKIIYLSETNKSEYVINERVTLLNNLFDARTNLLNLSFEA